MCARAHLPLQPKEGVSVDCAAADAVGFGLDDGLLQLLEGRQQLGHFRSREADPRHSANVIDCLSPLFHLDDPVLELGDLLLVVRPQPVVRAYRLRELLQPRLQARHLDKN